MPPKPRPKQAATSAQDKENVDPAGTPSKTMQLLRDKHKSEKRNHLQATFQATMAGTEQAMDEVSERAAADSKRAEIEARIIGRARVLEHAYFTADLELSEVLAAKLEDVELGPRFRNEKASGGVPSP